ncbi:MAG TPA: FecR domain-containing protein [Pyrinomonadaceae bacterium]|jgi:hypothetical protein|nr:FecR domain-containing protein [Pyrinomonadaceae bacterium]
MFGQHVTQELSAYAHGELSAGASARVAGHLRGCRRCRAGFAEIKFGIRLAESLPTRDAPASLWDNIEAALSKESAQSEQRHAARDARPSRRAPLAFTFGKQRALAFSLALLVVFGGGAWWLYMRATRTSWDVSRLAGAPTISSSRITDTGRLAVGEWLETDATSRAQLKVADIGQVEIEPETRIRLVETRLTEHRLELARGTLHARIYAPPRLFFVETPSAVAADLGCAYTLEVDDRGRSLLHVTSGWVALETRERESFVPAGAACATQKGTGPGTPFFEDAPEAFLDALAKFDFANGGTDALDAVLREARPRDTLSLWHLLARVGTDERARVYERLAAHAPPPAGVTRDGALALDAPMLKRWKDALEPTWQQESVPAARKLWRSLWK